MSLTLRAGRAKPRQYVLCIREANGAIVYLGPVSSPDVIAEIRRRYDVVDEIALQSAYSRGRPRPSSWTSGEREHDPLTPSQACYRAGCREPACREAHRLYGAEYRARRKAEFPIASPHGQG